MSKPYSKDKSQIIREYIERFSRNDLLKKMFNQTEIEAELNSNINNVVSDPSIRASGQYTRSSKDISFVRENIGAHTETHEATHSIFKGLHDPKGAFGFVISATDKGRGINEGGTEYIANLLTTDELYGYKPVNETDINGISLKTSSLSYPMETNVFERLVAMYGDEMMIDAMKNGPQELEKAMEKDRIILCGYTWEFRYYM